MFRLGVPSSLVVPRLEADLVSARHDLEQNPLFVTLPKDSKSRILKGEVARLKTNEELCNGAGINLNYFRSLFKYGSNHTHSSPFAFSQMDNFRPGDPESMRVFDLAVKTAIAFVALAIRDFVAAFQDQLHIITAEEKRLLAIWE